ncbi:MAG: GNAT family N-acetyltransferase [Geminicoccaceae bacterium]|nr:GNAT family N-acetyltransferase [Geminicoccaceae bacterium]
MNGDVLVRRHGCLIDTEPATTDLELVTSVLAGSYWAAGLSREVLERSIRHALVWNLREDAGGAQLGFARVVTDTVRFAWLSDVFIIERARGRGLGRFLVETVLPDPRVAAVERWLLATRDMHPLYRQFGFEDVPDGRYMVRAR